MVRDKNVPPDGGGNPRHNRLHTANGSIPGNGIEGGEKQNHPPSASSIKGNITTWGALSGDKKHCGGAVVGIPTKVVEKIGGQVNTNKLLSMITESINQMDHECAWILRFKNDGSTPFDDQHGMLRSGNLRKILLSLPELAETWVHYDSWILIHNHPERTGEVPSPSSWDERSTAVCSWISKSMGCEMIDHWIFTKDLKMFSFEANAPHFLRPQITIECRPEKEDDGKPNNDDGDHSSGD